MRSGIPFGRLGRSWILLFFSLCVFRSTASLPDDFYERLDVKKTATTAEIKKRYRSLALQYHPDHYKGEGDAQAIFRLVQEAYETLSDKGKRKIYDAYGASPYLQDLLEYFEQIDSQGIPELYRMNPYVLPMTSQTLQKVLVNSTETWVMTFYHPNCAPCREAVPVLTQVGKQAADLATRRKRSSSSSGLSEVKVGSVNCAMFGGLCQGMVERHLGEIHFYAPGQDESLSDREVYHGHKHAPLILERAQKLITSPVVKPASTREMTKRIAAAPQKSSIDKKSIKNAWLGVFTRPHCRPCTVLKAALRPLATRFESSVKFAMIDCSSTACSGVGHFPLVKLFVMREGRSFPDEYVVPYDTNDHPATLAMEVVGLIFQQVIGLNWAERDPVGDGNKREEL